MKNMRTPIVLTAILLILGGLAYWDEQESEKEVSAQKSKNKVFTADWEPAAIHYQSRGEKPLDVTLEKKSDGQWWITAPLLTRADQYETGKLWETIRDYQFEKEVTADSTKWGDFGLAEPAISVELRNGEKSFTFHMGAKAPVGYSIYSRTSSGNQVYLGSQFVVMPLTKTLLSLRSKSLVEIPAENLTQLVYEDAKNSPVTLDKKEGNWIMSAPEAFKVDSDTVLDYIGGLNRENATDIIDNPSEPLKQSVLKLVPPTTLIGRLSWKDNSGRVETLTFVENEEAVLAYQDINVRLTKLSKEAKGKVQKSADHFRDRRIFSFAAGDITKVKIDAVEFTLKGDVWEQSSQGPKSNIQVPFFLSRLANLKEIAKNPNVAMTTPATHKVELTFKDAGKPVAAVEIWKDGAEGGGVTLKTNQVDGNFVVPTDILGVLESEQSSGNEIGSGDTIDNQG